MDGAVAVSQLLVGRFLFLTILPSFKVSHNNYLNCTAVFKQILNLTFKRENWKQTHKLLPFIWCNFIDYHLHRPHSNT